MRKRIARPGAADLSTATASWLDLEHLVEVEVTSEDASNPIESALRPERPGCWRAAEPGAQAIRLHFDDALRLERIRLVFEERDASRTQEFALRWSADRGSTFRDIVRQQYTFSPPGTVREVEDYTVQLEGVTTLELHIIPSIAGGSTKASLAQWAVA
jgi:hypothetical protein